MLDKINTTAAIGGEDQSSTLELIEPILALQENEEELVFEAERKTPNGLVLK